MKKLQISVNGKKYIVDVEVLQDDENSMPDFPSGYTTVAPAPKVEVPQKPVMQKTAVSSSSSNQELETPMNGVVVEILVKPGDSVVAGQLCVALEVMKMKTNVNSAINGVIKSIDVKVGEQVELGQALLTFE